MQQYNLATPYNLMQSSLQKVRNFTIKRSEVYVDSYWTITVDYYLSKSDQ